MPAKILQLSWQRSAPSLLQYKNLQPKSNLVHLLLLWRLVVAIEVVVVALELEVA